MLTESERRLGVWTISAGNAGQGVAYAARQAGVPCSVVVFETAPQSKIERMRALGAKLIAVPYDSIGHVNTKDNQSSNQRLDG
jgi:threonine dehydratase